MTPKLLAALALFCTAAFGQTRGSISGEVADPSGAAIPGAKVTVKSPAIGLARETTTNDGGYFNVPTLPAGNYNVDVEAKGFKTLNRTGVRLDSDIAVSLKLQMEVGQLAERVEVTADVPMVETSNGEVSRMVTSQQLQNFALPGRNPFYMLGIMPGIVSRYGNFMTDFRGGSYSMGGLQINGQRKDTNFISVDGVNNGRNRDGVQQNNILGVDFIEEVKVQTTHYAAEYGRSTGAQINFITRRGTQDFHGSAYEFYFSDSFAACPYVVGCASKPRIRYHNYGFALGGPIYIPGKFNTEKNKLFFFVGMETRYNSGANQKISNIPTALERSGNFSASSLKPIDPTTGAPFPNNIIPTSRISNLGQGLQKMYPDPNYNGPGGNYYASAGQPTESRDMIYRVDYNIRPNWQLSVRAMPGTQDFTSWFDNTGNNIPLFQVYRQRYGDNYVATLTTAVNSSTINELSYGYSAYREGFNILGDGVKRSKYGITFPPLFSVNNPDRIPVVSISGMTGFGAGQANYARTPTFILRENFSKIIGSHTLKAGVYFEWMNMNELSAANENGSFGFGSSSSNPRNSGNPWANALLGNFDSYSETGPPAQTVYKAYDRELYVQDSWRMNRRLSLEYGIRWAFISPWGAKWNNVVSWMQQFWDPAKAPQVAANGSIVNGTGDPYNGLVLPGTGFPDDAKGRVAVYGDPAVNALFRGVPEKFNPTRMTNFQPRLSFAYDVFGNGKLAIRAGAGIFQGVTGIAYSGWYLGARPPLTLGATVTNGSSDNPGSGIPSNTKFPIGVGGLPTDYKIPTMYNYSFGVQTQLPYKTQLDVSYVGNSGRHLSLTRNLNQVSPEVQQAHQGVDLRPYYTYRGVGGINMVEPMATSSYNSLQVAARRRTGQLTYSVSYTLGKIMGYGNEGVAGGMQNAFDIKSEKSELEESRKHWLVISHTWDLPWYREQKGFVGRLAGGWSVSGVWTITSGRLYGPSVTSVARGVAIRPDLVGSWYLEPDQRSLFRYFKTEAFARAADWTYGNAGKWIVRGPGSIDLSAFVTKDVRVAEQYRFQLRMETFNALNHMNLSDINTQLGNRSFGQISGVGSSRYVQIGAKFIF
ncbi:MAG: TonB-dependent receptor [Acidobacteria bacterium]|nr:TonB-dependent receptor [Acidobacteriota bacterium]